MEIYEWMEHNGVRMLYLALATQTTAELVQKIAVYSPVIEKEHPGSVRCIVNVKDGRFNTEVSKILKGFLLHNAPYMKMTVLIGVEGLQRALMDALIMVTRRKNLVIKDTLDQAKDFLASL